VQTLLGNSLAIIPNLKVKLVGVASKPNGSSGGGRVTMNIGQGFLQDPEEDEFTLSRWALHFFLDITMHFNSAATSESFGEPPGGRADAGFVEQRRVKQI
jgi:hypothetical protein